MKRLSKFTSLFAMAALLFGGAFFSCSDGDGSSDSNSGSNSSGNTDDEKEGTLTSGDLTTARKSEGLTTATTAGTITVTKNGVNQAYSGTTIAGAIALIPESGSDSYVITLAPGKYSENGLTIKTSNNVTIKGTGTKEYGLDVLIYGQGTDMSAESTRSTLSFQKSGNIVLENLTVQNSYGMTTGTAQAEALGVGSSEFSGTLAAYNCSFLSGQDTICTYSKAWFYKCYIEGDVDFIWMEWKTGKVALYENCVLRAIGGRTTTAYFTAPRLNVSNTVGKGVVLWKSTLEAEDTLTEVYLGRNPWDKGTSYFNNYYENVAVVGCTYVGKALNEAIWAGSGANGTENQQFVGFKTDTNFPVSSAKSTNCSARLTSAQVTAEYSNRNLILNRVYNIVGAEFENDSESEIWDTTELAAAWSAGESGALPGASDDGTVKVTWDWVSERVTQSTDKTNWGTSDLDGSSATVYLKGDNDTVFAEGTGGQFKIATGSNPYGTFNNGATMKIPVSSGSVVTVTAWDSTAAGNLTLGGKKLTAISGNATSSEAVLSAAKAGYIELTSLANSTYIRKVEVTKVNPADSFTTDAIDWAEDTVNLTVDSDTTGITVSSIKTEPDSSIATAILSGTTLTIKSVESSGGTTSVVLQDADSHEATVSITVNKYGVITTSITKYVDTDAVPELGVTYVYIFDTARYALQTGETDAAGQLTSTGYTSTFLTLEGASIASTNHGINGSATMTLKVPAGTTTLTFVDCCYGNHGTVTVTDAGGTLLTSISKTANSSSDNDTTGAEGSFTSDTTQTVTITLPSGGYTHAMKVITVSN